MPGNPRPAPAKVPDDDGRPMPGSSWLVVEGVMILAEMPLVGAAMVGTGDTVTGAVCCVTPGATGLAAV